MIGFDLYLITDPQAPGGVVEVTRRALDAAPPGRVAVQLRARSLAPDARLRLGHDLRRVTADAGALLLVNREADLAARIAADGLHLPDPHLGDRSEPGSAEKDPLPGTVPELRGVSCHDLEGVRRARRDGAAFVTLSPFAESPGKGEPLAAARFTEIAAEAVAMGIPVLALGGIDPTSAGRAVAAGASGVAVIRAVYRAPDPAQAVQQLIASLDTARRSRR